MPQQWEWWLSLDEDDYDALTANEFESFVVQQFAPQLATASALQFRDRAQRVLQRADQQAQHVQDRQFETQAEISARAGAGDAAADATTQAAQSVYRDTLEAERGLGPVPTADTLVLREVEDIYEQEKNELRILGDLMATSQASIEALTPEHQQARRSYEGRFGDDWLPQVVERATELRDKPQVGGGSGPAKIAAPALEFMSAGVRNLAPHAGQRRRWDAPFSATFGQPGSLNVLDRPGSAESVEEQRLEDLEWLDSQRGRPWQEMDRQDQIHRMRLQQADKLDIPTPYSRAFAEESAELEEVLGPAMIAQLDTVIGSSSLWDPKVRIAAMRDIRDALEVVNRQVGRIWEEQSEIGPAAVYELSTGILQDEFQKITDKHGIALAEIVGAIFLDPTNFIGLGLMGKIPLAGKLLGPLERAFINTIDDAFLRAGGVITRAVGVPAGPTARAFATKVTGEFNSFMTRAGVMGKEPGVVMQLLVEESVGGLSSGSRLGRRSLGTEENPFLFAGDVGEFSRLRTTVNRMIDVDPDAAERLAGASIEEAGDQIGDFAHRLIMADYEANPAARLSVAVKGKGGLLPPAEDSFEVLWRQMGLIGSALRSMNGLAGKVAYKVAGTNQSSPLVRMRMGQGIVGTGVDRSWNALKAVHRNVNLPLAHANLWFGTYAIGNVFETYMLSALNGVPSMKMTTKHYAGLQTILGDILPALTEDGAWRAGSFRTHLLPGENKGMSDIVDQYAGVNWSNDFEISQKTEFVGVTLPREMAQSQTLMEFQDAVEAAVRDGLPEEWAPFADQIVYQARIYASMQPESLQSLATVFNSGEMNKQVVTELMGGYADRLPGPLLKHVVDYADGKIGIDDLKARGYAELDDWARAETMGQPELMHSVMDELETMAEEITVSVEPFAEGNEALLVTADAGSARLGPTTYREGGPLNPDEAVIYVTNREGKEVVAGRQGDWRLIEEPADLPQRSVYHVTPRGQAVQAEGVLRAGGPTEEGRLGASVGGFGDQATGQRGRPGELSSVSFTASPLEAQSLRRDLRRRIEMAQATTPEERTNLLLRYVDEDVAAGHPAGDDLRAVVDNLRERMESGSLTEGGDPFREYLIHRDGSSGAGPGAMETAVDFPGGDPERLREGPVQGRHTNQQFENPVLFGGDDVFRGLDPEDVEVIQVPIENLPKDAAKLITTAPKRGFNLHEELRVFGDVELRGSRVTGVGDIPGYGRQELIDGLQWQYNKWLIEASQMPQRIMGMTNVTRDQLKDAHRFGSVEIADIEMKEALERVREFVQRLREFGNLHGLEGRLHQETFGAIPGATAGRAFPVPRDIPETIKDPGLGQIADVFLRYQAEYEVKILPLFQEAAAATRSSDARRLWKLAQARRQKHWANYSREADALIDRAFPGAQRLSGMAGTPPAGAAVPEGPPAPAPVAADSGAIKRQPYLDAVLGPKHDAFRALLQELESSKVVVRSRRPDGEDLVEFFKDLTRRMRDPEDATLSWNAQHRHDTRAAAQRTRKKLDATFINYDGTNSLDEVMRYFDPFWVYQSRRIARVAKESVKHPGLISLYEDYFNNSNQGYITLGDSEYEIDPTRGTILSMIGAGRRKDSVLDPNEAWRWMTGQGGDITKMIRGDRYGEQFSGPWGKAEKVQEVVAALGIYPGALMDLGMNTVRAIFNSAEASNAHNLELGGSLPPLIQMAMGIVERLGGNLDLLRENVRDRFERRTQKLREADVVSDLMKEHANQADGPPRPLSLPSQEEIEDMARRYKGGDMVWQALLGMLRLRTDTQNDYRNHQNQYYADRVNATPEEVEERRREGELMMNDPIANGQIRNTYPQAVANRLREATRQLQPEVMQRIGEQRDEMNTRLDEVDTKWRPVMQAKFNNPDANGDAIIDMVRQFYEDANAVRSEYALTIPQSSAEWEALRSAYGLQISDESGLTKLLNGMNQLKPENFRNPDTLLIDWDAFFGARDKLTAGQPQAVLDDFETLTRLNDMDSGIPDREMIREASQLWRQYQELPRRYFIQDGTIFTHDEQAEQLIDAVAKWLGQKDEMVTVKARKEAIKEDTGNTVPAYALTEVQFEEAANDGILDDFESTEQALYALELYRADKYAKREMRNNEIKTDRQKFWELVNDPESGVHYPGTNIGLLEVIYMNAYTGLRPGAGP